MRLICYIFSCFPFPAPELDEVRCIWCGAEWERWIREPIWTRVGKRILDWDAECVRKKVLRGK